MPKNACWLIVAMALAACGKTPSPPAAPVPSAAPLPESPQLARGHALYLEHCAQCHGPQAQGHPDWQTPSDGSFTAAPPLNGTGTDAGRTRQQLLAVIEDGARRNGVAVMPAWRGRLSPDDIDAILGWCQSLWPRATYERWLKANDTATGDRHAGRRS